MIDLSLVNLTFVLMQDLGKCPRCPGLFPKILIISNGESLRATSPGGGGGLMVVTRD